MAVLRQPPVCAIGFGNTDQWRTLDTMLNQWVDSEMSWRATVKPDGRILVEVSYPKMRTRPRTGNYYGAWVLDHVGRLERTWDWMQSTTWQPRV